MFVLVLSAILIDNDPHGWSVSLLGGGCGFFFLIYYCICDAWGFYRPLISLDTKLCSHDLPSPPSPALLLIAPAWDVHAPHYMVPHSLSPCHPAVIGDCCLGALESGQGISRIFLSFAPSEPPQPRVHWIAVFLFIYFRYFS